MANSELSGVCLSVPSVVSDKGIKKIIASPLTGNEMRALENSAGILHEAIRSLGLD